LLLRRLLRGTEKISLDRLVFLVGPQPEETAEPQPELASAGRRVFARLPCPRARTDPYQSKWWALGLADARPVEQKKGADKGIDGRLYFHDEPKATKQIIFSVKAGSLHANYVRDLRGVIEREKAALGVLITMEQPTQPMRSEAASAGFYQALWGKAYPRLHLLTVADLLSGKTVEQDPFPSESGRHEHSCRRRHHHGESNPAETTQ
jgi:Restriction endonuclease